MAKDSYRFDFGGIYFILMNQRSDLNDIRISTHDRSIQLIRFLPQNNKFEITKEAAEFLASLRGDIAFVVICGKYRTGKSFLMNKLLDVGMDGFQVAPSTDSCTQGIWLCTKALVNQSNGLQIYFLDTEGSQSTERNQTHDAKVFSLAILLSSIFMFNSQGCIDEQSIAQLQLTTTLAKNIQVQDQHSENNESLIGYYTPKFIWLLRDYVLEMQDKHGRAITPKEYLENCLNEESAYAKTNEQNRKIRKALLQFFKDRNCVTLIRPATNEDQLKQLNSLPFTSLRKEFQTALLKLRETILKECTPKQLNGVNLNGRMYLDMIQNYVEIMNRGGVPNISTAWEHIVENECQFGFEEAKKNYESKLKTHFSKDEARTFEEMFKVLKELRDESYEKFHQIAGIREKNQYFEAYRQRLQDYMDEKENLAIKINNDINATRNQELIGKFAKELKDNLHNSAYSADDIDLFLEHFNLFLTNYDQEACGPSKANSLIHFLQTNHPTFIQQLVKSIRTKYDNKKSVEQEKSVYLEKEKNYQENIKLLEQNIKSNENKLKKLDQEKVQLEKQKKDLQETLDKLSSENKTMKNNTKDMDDLKQQILQKEDEIQMLKKQLQTQALSQKKKSKGCCG